MKYRIRFEVFSHIINPPPPSLGCCEFFAPGKGRIPNSPSFSTRRGEWIAAPANLFDPSEAAAIELKNSGKLRYANRTSFTCPPSFSFFSFLFSPSLRLHVARDVSTYKYARCRGDKATGCPRAARLLWIMHRFTD